METVAKQSGITEKPDDAEIKQFIKEVDDNGDGKIGLQEFLDFMAKLLAPVIDSMKLSSEKTVNQ